MVKDGNNRRNQEVGGLGKRKRRDGARVREGAELRSEAWKGRRVKDGKIGKILKDWEKRFATAAIAEKVAKEAEKGDPARSLNTALNKDNAEEAEKEAESTHR